MTQQCDDRLERKGEGSRTYAGDHPVGSWSAAATPPDKQPAAINLVMQQAELLCQGGISRWLLDAPPISPVAWRGRATAWLEDFAAAKGN